MSSSLHWILSLALIAFAPTTEVIAQSALRVSTISGPDSSGNSWVFVPGMSTYLVSSMVTSPTGDVFAGTFNGPVLRSTNHGDTWTILRGTEHVYQTEALAVDRNGTIYAAFANPGIEKTSDFGNTWDTVYANANVEYSRVFVADSGLILATTYMDGLYQSSDGGAAWSRPLLTSSDGVLIARSGTILVGSDMPSFDMFRSTNRGALWTGLPVDSIGGVTALVQTVSGRILASNGWGSVYSSTDDGISWMERGSFPVANRQEYLLQRDGNVLATTARGVVRSTDEGLTWQTWGTVPLDTLSVWTMTCDSAGYAYAATDHGLMRTANAITGIRPGPDIPKSAWLAQNFPNPFNPSTTIRYALSQRSRVMLTVFNTLGQQVATLVDAVEDRGEYNVRFDGSGIASGVYFYRLQTGEYVATKRLVVLR